MLKYVTQNNANLKDQSKVLMNSIKDARAIRTGDDLIPAGPLREELRDEMRMLKQVRDARDPYSCLVQWAKDKGLTVRVFDPRTDALIAGATLNRGQYLFRFPRIKRSRADS
jgi:hypothetical protein